MSTQTTSQPSAANRAAAVKELSKALGNKRQNETTARGHLANALKHLGRETELEFDTGAGRCDIYLPARRFVIETKRPGQADPDKERPGNDDTPETQFEQCERYVKGDYERERDTLSMDDITKSDEPWRACLTDIHNWWVWEWRAQEDGSLTPPLQPIQKQFNSSQAEELVDWLTGLTQNTAGKPWVPQHTAPIFIPYRDKLEALYRADTTPSRDTKFSVWLDMLRGSGSDPSEADQVDLFIDHTLLVTIARAVIASLTGDKRKPIEVMSDGFASWPHRPDKKGASSENGEEWTKQLFELIHQYDWRQRGRDVLRDLYQELVPKQHRKDYGEYYTPDWLAEGVVREVLDDEWIERSVKAVLKTPNVSGIGVLDPACGSGTFLFHAAKRILGSQVVKKQNLTDVQKAKLATDLVNGIDIHPVAVEMARATLLRALPCNPLNGEDALQIFQGDSLLYNKHFKKPGQDDSQQLSAESVDGQFQIKTPKLRTLTFPDSLITQKAFRSYISIFVKAAWDKSEMPELKDLVASEEDRGNLSSQFEALTQIIDTEGDNVWSWFIQNYTGPSALEERGVDRIVANPPWVRMSNIQHADRKEELEDLAKKLGYWQQGKNNTGFDIAGLFVHRCTELYLQSENRAGWVLPWGCIKASNWERYRGRLTPGINKIWDLSRIKNPPFSGSKSAIWFRDGKKRTDSLPPLKIYENKESSEKIHPSSTWDEAESKLEVVEQRIFPKSPSDYFEGSKALFAQGATLVPHCLVKVTDYTKAESKQDIKITTTESRQKPWKALGRQKGTVPKKWLRTIVGSDSLLPFAVLENEKFIIPVIDGEEDESKEDNSYWLAAESLYAANRGKGTSTPKTLFDNLNFQNKLLKQNWQKSAQGRLVVYNTSGSKLRASRLNDTELVVSSSYYWYLSHSPDEAKYLAAILNAGCLQGAFKLARKSDRHFHQHFWSEVPIPKFNEADGTHKVLAELCEEAELIAASLGSEFMKEAKSRSQNSRSEEIRDTLRVNGIAARIDGAVAKLLPYHVS